MLRKPHKMRMPKSHGQRQKERRLTLVYGVLVVLLMGSIYLATNPDAMAFLVPTVTPTPSPILPSLTSAPPTFTPTFVITNTPPITSTPTPVPPSPTPTSVVSDTPMPVTLPENQIYYVVSDQRANVRSCASTECVVIIAIARGQSVTVMETTGDWSAIELDDGRVGYVASFLLGENPP